MAYCRHNPVGISLEIDDDQHAKSVLENFNRMRERKEECDLIIKAEGKEMHAHRMVLRAGSPYFDKMFSHDTREKQSGIVEMKDIGFSVLEKGISFLYTGKLIASGEECEPLLHVATLLQLTTICDKVEGFLKSRLDAGSFFIAKRVACKFDLESLNEACDNFALENFDVLVEEEEFASFEKGYVTFLLTSEKLKQSVTEDSKLASVVRWINFDYENRQKELLDLMNVLNMTKVTLQYGRFLAQNEKIFKESAECTVLLFLGVTEKSNFETSPVISKSEANSLLIFNTASNYVEAYQVLDQSWSSIHPLHERMQKAFFTSVVYNEFLFVLIQNKEVYKLNLKNKSSSWVRLRSMTNDHGRFMRATALDKWIYVVGDTMERYSIAADEWKSVETDNIPCHESTVVDYFGEIYVLGGFRMECLCDVNKYSPITLAWSPVKPMLVGKDAPAATVYNGKIFVAGGDSNSGKEAEFYDRESNSWTRIFLMNVERYGFGLCVVDNKLFAVGRNGRCDVFTAEVYDVEKNVWTDTLNIPQKEIMSRATVSVNLSR